MDHLVLNNIKMIQSAIYTVDVETDKQIIAVRTTLQTSEKKMIYNVLARVKTLYWNSWFMLNILTSTCSNTQVLVL